ncbi:hypothetical protein LTR70_006183 [Exophiala xenobiotica]|uniref:Uncharacterized protein n=1 Tax=Lithohypha guttulata TaxID=1690604 RepID=A0ABR0K7P0_9EURO|nr:hypothetical protein LTR24_005860 [Lithohypha guttulata]KAK5316634.1 hypothetical protein LTR70_006183 [Exophiala xenobiotica]
MSVSQNVPQDQPSYFMLTTGAFSRAMRPNNGSINHALFVSGNQFFLGQPQTHPQPQGNQQQNSAQAPQQQLVLPVNFVQLPLVIHEQILVPFIDQRPVRIVNPWFFQWRQGANRSNVHDPTVPTPKSYASFRNAGVQLRVPSDIRNFALSSATFRGLLETYGHHKIVIISNCYLSQLVSSLNTHTLLQKILRTLLRRTRTMLIETGRYHRLEGRISDFSQYCDSVRYIEVQCGHERGCKWVANPATHRRRVHRHLSYTWRPHGQVMAIPRNTIAGFVNTNAWPVGLERDFRRYLCSTAEWRNAQGLLQAIIRRRQRRKEKHPIRMTFEIEFMVMRLNHPNSILQISNHGGFVVLVSLPLPCGSSDFLVLTQANPGS